jgi:triphosphatase
MEIEHKFRVDDAQVFATLLALRELAGYTLRPEREPEQQHNTYLDTPDGRLQAGHYGLRVRALPDRRIVTLKGRASGQAGRYTRDEWEVEIGDDDTPAAWPPSEVRSRTLALIGDQPLTPLLTIITNRHNIAVMHAGDEVAELSLDEGTIYAGQRSQAFRELEVELHKNGTAHDLDALCEALLALFPLVADDRSKLAKGLALVKETSV